LFIFSGQLNGSFARRLDREAKQIAPPDETSVFYRAGAIKKLRGKKTSRRRPFGQ